jgi:hypothetical protein
VIRTYRYIHTVHSKLHDYVLAFFLKIETDTFGFRDELFELEFLPIVNRHHQILKERFKTIYDYVNSLSETNRKLFCQRIFESNQIEMICRGEYRPKAFTGDLTEIEVTLKQLFLDLYIQVLDGSPFQESANTTLREHFNQFCDTNEDITLCPFCGIGELKKSQDKTRDQYDHYLPKSLYPFSSINFQNLVPSCKDCNSFDVKGNKDTIAVSTGKFFFPYDDNHKELSLVLNVRQDNAEIAKIDWELVFNSPDNKNDEIQSWKSIYSIEDRYQGYIQSRTKKWYTHFYEYNKSLKSSGIDHSTRIICYMKYIEQDNNLGLSYIRKRALEGLLLGSNIVQAEVEALEYV